MTFTRTTYNGKQYQVIISKTTKKEACKLGGLHNKKGFTPLVVCFGEVENVLTGYGYTTQEAINNAKN